MDHSHEDYEDVLYDEDGNDADDAFPHQYVRYGTRTCPLCLTSFILSIVGPFLSLCCGLLTLPIAVAAVITGHVGLQQVKHAGGHLTGGGFAIAGLIIGYLTLLLFVCGLILLFVLNSEEILRAFP